MKVLSAENKGKLSNINVSCFVLLMSSLLSAEQKSKVQSCRLKDIT